VPGSWIGSKASLKKWSAKLERIAQRLGGNKTQHDAALAELRTIGDPSAIPAIELVLAGRDEKAALAAVEAITKIDRPEASLALAKQGVFSIWPEIRKASQESLKVRVFEEFIPALIALLTVPGQTEFRLVYDPSRDVLQYAYIMATETENQFQVEALSFVNQIIYVQSDMVMSKKGRTFDQISGGPSRFANNDEARSVNDRLYALDRRREADNDRRRELNERVVALLAEVCRQEATPDARKWWDWWYAYTDAPPASAKSTVVVSVEEVETLPSYVPYTRFTDGASHSCFAAGTPVWTQSGPVSIELIQVGDLVLAQDIPSGELAYKPVLVATVNPPRDLLTLRTGDDSIVSTKGHRFWTSGSGWMKARDLAPQMLLHTVTGSTPVWSVKPAPAEKTYNLVVDGFHTYFVGKSAILCQDLRSSNSDNRAVPGLARK
jgi:hypothetical protein